MPAPAVPRKTQIRLAIAARLQGVRSGNGYWTEIGLNVAKDRKPIQNHRASELPRAVPVWMNARPAEGGCIGPTAKVACPFVIYVVLGGPRGSIQDQVDRAEQDVTRALFSDPTLGGLIETLEYVGSDTDQQLLVAEDDGALVRAQIAVTFEAKYKTTAATL